MNNTENTGQNEKSLADRLKIARTQAGLSQGQIAIILGLHRPTISEIEAGRRKVSTDELVAFAKHYRVSLNWLTGADQDSSDGKPDRVAFAARELVKISSEDLDKVMNLLRTLRESDDD
jgi:transcriptional regulator with XRE-family HTH domain